MAAPSLDFLDGWKSLSASRVDQDLLTQRSIEYALPTLLARRRDRLFDFDMAKAILSRMPSSATSAHLVHELAKPRLKLRADGREYLNYAIFDFFPSTLLLNYNLDGLADDICGHRHHVIPVHGTVQAHLGAQRFAEVLDMVREFGFPMDFNDLLLCVPEPACGQPGHRQLMARLSPLSPLSTFNPDFVAICGYSFASLDPTSGKRHDDHESLRLFTERFRTYGGPVYVLNPDRSVKEMIEDRLKSPNVIWVGEKWNVISEAMMDRILYGDTGTSLRDACARIDDRTGGYTASHRSRVSTRPFFDRGRRQLENARRT